MIALETLGRCDGRSRWQPKALLHFLLEIFHFRISPWKKIKVKKKSSPNAKTMGNETMANETLSNVTMMNSSTVGPTMEYSGVGSPSVGVIAYFSFCLFMANGVVSCLGFGMAMSFLFFYHIGELGGIMEDKCCNLRVAVFLQVR